MHSNNINHAQESCMSGNLCPDFTLPATSGKTFTLSSAAKPLVIYFYP